MTTARVPVNPTVLRYYINQSYCQVEELSRRSQLGKLTDWLSGQLNPTYKQLVTLAKALRIPVGYLVLDEPIDDTPDLVEYRTIDSKYQDDFVSRDLIETIQIAEKQQEFMSDYRKEISWEPLTYVGSCDIDTDFSSMVLQARRLLRIEEKWQGQLNSQKPFKFFRERLNEIGVLVFSNSQVGLNTRRPLDIEEFRAFVILDDYAPYIFINSQDSINGQLYSLLHEFAHILLGQNEIQSLGERYNDVSELERLCNQFTAELLVPLKLFLISWESNLDQSVIEKISELATQFKVSRMVIARRALDQNLIQMSVYDEIATRTKEDYLKYKEERNKTDGRGNFWNLLFYRLDNNLINSAFYAYQQGDIRYSDVADLLNVSVSTLSTLEKKWYQKEVNQ